MAEAGRRAVEVARSEIATLNPATIEQTRQMEETIKRINDLSAEIQKDVSHIIVAMQFQDITPQKLERLHKPTSAPPPSCCRCSPTRPARCCSATSTAP